MASPFIVSRGIESSRSSAERLRELYSLPRERRFLPRIFSQMQPDPSGLVRVSLRGGQQRALSPGTTRLPGHIALPCAG